MKKKDGSDTANPFAAYVFDGDDCDSVTYFDGVAIRRYE